MNKFTTQQLKDAFIELAARKDADAAYRLAFDELERRLGDDEFDSFLDSVGV
jgi:hypothetical protein